MVTQKCFLMEKYIAKIIFIDEAIIQRVNNYPHSLNF